MSRMFQVGSGPLPSHIQAKADAWKAKKQGMIDSGSFPADQPRYDPSTDLGYGRAQPGYQPATMSEGDYSRGTSGMSPGVTAFQQSLGGFPSANQTTVAGMVPSSYGTPGQIGADRERAINGGPPGLGGEKAKLAALPPVKPMAPFDPTGQQMAATPGAAVGLKSMPVTPPPEPMQAYGTGGMAPPGYGSLKPPAQPTSNPMDLVDELLQAPPPGRGALPPRQPPSGLPQNFNDLQPIMDAGQPQQGLRSIPPSPPIQGLATPPPGMPDAFASYKQTAGQNVAAANSNYDQYMAAQLAHLQQQTASQQQESSLMQPAMLMKAMGLVQPGTPEHSHLQSQLMSGFGYQPPAPAPAAGGGGLLASLLGNTGLGQQQPGGLDLDGMIYGGLRKLAGLFGGGGGAAPAESPTAGGKLALPVATPPTMMGKLGRFNPSAPQLTEFDPKRSPLERSLTSR